MYSTFFFSPVETGNLNLNSFLIELRDGVAVTEFLAIVYLSLFLVLLVEAKM